jgi:pyocin large subunit-like protein
MGSRFWVFTPLALRSGPAAAAAALSVLALAACDGAPSAVPARAHAANDGLDRRLADAAPDGGDARSEGRYGEAAYAPAAQKAPAADAPLYKGKPIWTANKRHSAQDNADFHFKRDGEAVGATSVDDFVAKVRAFIDSPPKDALTLTRANGDRLIYDPKTNLFAATDKDGVPRTLFKPRDGAAYWQQQKDSVAKGEDFPTEQRRTARRTQDGDNG